MGKEPDKQVEVYPALYFVNREKTEGINGILLNIT